MCYWDLNLTLQGQLSQVDIPNRAFPPPAPDPLYCPMYYVSLQGPISYICIPPTRGTERSGLADAGLFLSGAVGGDIKIWDYQVR